MRNAILIFLLGLSCLPVCAQNYIITTVVGNGLPATRRPAVGALLSELTSIAVDPSTGVLYFTADNCVFRVNRLGVLERAAGAPLGPGFSGDGGPATSAQLNGPLGLAVDSAGNVYVNDTNNHRVRRIAPDGIITTAAGNGHAGVPTDGGLATNTEFIGPWGIAVDAAGDLYISDYKQIHKVTPDGIITGLTNGRVFDSPSNLAFDADGDLYVVEDGYTLLKFWHDGHLSLFAGNGTVGYGGDDGPATLAEMDRPMGLSVDKAGNVYFGDYINHRIREISTDGIIRTIAGGDQAGYTYDGGLATESLVSGVMGTAVDPDGNVLFVDLGCAVRIIDSQGVLGTIVGTPQGGLLGEGGPATAAQLLDPQALATDNRGNLYIADFDRALRVAADGTITTIAGGGIPGATSFAGAVGGYSFALPMGIAVDSSGNVYVSDTSRNQVMQIGPNGAISRYAGTGKLGYSGDWGPASYAQLNGPRDLAVDGDDALYIADFGNYAIRKVNKNGTIYTVAGNGKSGPHTPDGVSATSTAVGVMGLAIDTSGNIYFTDDDRIHMVSAVTGLLSTVAVCSDPDGAPTEPASLAVDASGNVYFLDIYRRNLREVSAATGLISTIAGDGLQGYSGDMGPAANAAFNSPLGLAVDFHGNLYVSDYGNANVRAVVPESRAVLGVNLAWPGVVPGHRRGRFRRVATTVSAVISNAANSSATAGAVATATMSPGAILLSISGDGWSCTDNSCSRHDRLSAGESYPPLVISAEVEGQTTIQVAASSSYAFPASGTVLVDIPDVNAPRRLSAR